MTRCQSIHLNHSPLVLYAYYAYLTRMDTTYKAGTLITAHCEPNTPLIINRYLDRIYYCEAVNDPTHQLLAYFERELIPPATSAKK